MKLKCFHRSRTGKICDYEWFSNGIVMPKFCPSCKQKGKMIEVKEQ